MYSVVIDSSVNNVPVAFDESAGSRVAVSLPANSRIQILNCTNEVIAFTVADYNEAPESTITSQGYCINQGTTTWDEFHISNRATLYVRSAGAAITSGKIYIQMWGRR